MRTVARSFVIMIGGLRRPCVDFDQPSAATCAEMASLLAIAAGAGHGAGGPGPIGATFVSAGRRRLESTSARNRSSPLPDSPLSRDARHSESRLLFRPPQHLARSCNARRPATAFPRAPLHRAPPQCATP
ncbi:hypothetical protein WS67_20245 [Burkholderia singularis]|uniref:Uncharacterized protein n=1 Tax=Burkholderia singularis TaxID=1503053 RepID=A0A103DY62_9BURK|nr:hypothetical protein WS67_20245 [Burkholderia singularis]